MDKLTIRDVAFAGKRVLMRVDFNVPLEGGRVASDKRIRAALPSIRHIIEQKGRLILASHLGRPGGEPVAALSLAPVARALGELLGKKVAFAGDCVGNPAETAAAALADGDVLLLENLRFHAGETDNDPAFSRRLAALATVFVNDAFGTAHRAHASTEGVARLMKTCAAGFLMEKELAYLGRVLESPVTPFVAILGGAKISGKIDVIANLLPRVDTILIGGGMAYTFFRAQGFEIGASLLEEDKLALASRLLEEGGDRIVLPVDCMVTDRFDFAERLVGQLKAVPVEAIPPGWSGLDIGPETVQRFAAVLQAANTIVWNGPMGVFEIEATARGTFSVAEMLARATEKGATTVIGGGDSASAIQQAGMADRVSHVSTGGGASLELMEGKVLPGVAALSDR
jgi:phosphoglycerate kinase